MTRRAGWVEELWSIEKWVGVSSGVSSGGHRVAVARFPGES